MLDPLDWFFDELLTQKQVPSSSSNIQADSAMARSPDRRRVEASPPSGSHRLGTTREGLSSPEVKLLIEADANVEVVPNTECDENRSDAKKSGRSRSKTKSLSFSGSSSHSRSHSLGRGRDRLRSRTRSSDGEFTARTSGDSSKGVVSSNSRCDKRRSGDRSKSRTRRQTRISKSEKEENPSKVSPSKISRSAATATIPSMTSPTSAVCVGETLPSEENSAGWRRNDQRKPGGQDANPDAEDNLNRCCLDGPTSRRTLVSTRKAETSVGKTSRKCSLSFSNHSRIGRHERKRPSTNKGVTTDDAADGVPSFVDKDRPEKKNIGVSLSQSNHSHGGHRGDRRRRSSKPRARASGETLSNKSGHQISGPSGAKVPSGCGHGRRLGQSVSGNCEADAPQKTRSRSRNSKRRPETKTSRAFKPHRAMSSTATEEKKKCEKAIGESPCSDARVNETIEDCGTTLSTPIRVTAEVVANELHIEASTETSKEVTIKVNVESRNETSHQEIAPDANLETMASLPLEDPASTKSGLFSRMSKSFSSLFDEGTVISEAVSMSKVSIPGIFGHFNKSITSITTSDIAGTLAPYFSGQCDSIGTLNSDAAALESRFEEEEVEESVKQKDIFADWHPLDFTNFANETTFTTKLPSTLDALLDSKPRKFATTLAEPSICSSCPNSPLRSNSKRNLFSDPSVLMAPLFESAFADVIPEDESVTSSQPLGRIRSTIAPPSISSDVASVRQSQSKPPSTLFRPTHSNKNIIGAPGNSEDFLLFQGKKSIHSDDAVAGDVVGKDTPTGRKKAESFLSVSHVKLHKGAGVTSTATSLESKYLQLDFASMGNGSAKGQGAGSPAAVINTFQNCPATAPGRTRHATTKDSQKMPGIGGYNNLFPTPPLFGRNGAR